MIALSPHLLCKIKLSSSPYTGAFVFIDVPTTDSYTWYDTYETPFSRVTFTVRLRRKPIYYVINLLIPSIVFCVLTMITLTLQPGSPDRTALGLYCHYCSVRSINQPIMFDFNTLKTQNAVNKTAVIVVVHLLFSSCIILHDGK